MRPWTRKDTHAGSWYTSDREKLKDQLEGWLSSAKKKIDVSGKNVRAIIGPHAGYSYSGEAAGYAYCAIDPRRVKRVFVLGPSHHVYTKKCHVTRASHYRTPIGSVAVDRRTCEALVKTGRFTPMEHDVDEDEHSIEMHIPFIAAVMRGHDFQIVPIMVGSLDFESEKLYGALLSKFLKDKENFFVISSDFCHWGRRFRFQWHDEKLGPIYKSIEWLDKEAMKLIETGSCDGFSAYLKKYKNTICGRHPIGLLLQMIRASDDGFKISFTHYSQSDKCKKCSDSSVSYASAIVTGP